MERVVIRFCIMVFACLVLCDGVVLGQVSRLKTVATRTREASASSSGEVLTIRKMTGIGPRAKIQTPTYNTSVSRGVNPAQLWGQIEVIYETGRTDEQNWFDELSFHYYALALKIDDKERKYSLYKKNVFYVDVMTDRKPMLHRSTVFLRPGAIMRYGELVAVAVEISYNGTIIAKMSEEDPSSKLPAGEWWNNPLVTENPLTVTREGCLLDRAHSPFALINIDDYEVIK